MPYITPRYFGKTAYVIRRALASGGAIAVTREATKQRILEVASIMGVAPPKIIIIQKDKATAAAPAVALFDYDL